VLEFEAIGTHWQIDLPKDIAPGEETRVRILIDERIEEFDKNYSRFRDDSLVTEMSKRAGEYTLPEDAKPMMDLYEKMYRITGGLMTPLIGQVLVDAGYDAEYSLQPKPLTAPPAWDDVIDYHFPTLTLKKPVLLDFGAMGKGYLIDIVGELLERNGIREYTIDAGGDIRHTGGEPLRVGLENPLDFTEALGIATIADQSICGSAGNRRAWANYHHIMNPATLSSPTDILAVWATAKTTLLADALTTALFFTDYKILHQHFPFEFLLIKADASVYYSPYFPGETFVPHYAENRRSIG